MSGSSRVDDAIAAAAQRYGVDPALMRRIAQIESGGDAANQTGSYRGLYQLSPAEFARYGGQGDIFDPVANANAAAAKFSAETRQFRDQYGRDPTAADLYLVHQQGQGGAAAHWANPDAPAWQNMASTGEGRQRGEAWAKQAIWGNIPDAMKRQFGSVDNVSSRDFTSMWQAKVDGGSGALPNVAAVQGQEPPRAAPVGAPSVAEAPSSALPTSGARSMPRAGADPVSRALSLAQASEPSAPQFMPLPVAPVGANPAALRLASAVTPYAGNSQPLALARGGAAKAALRLARADGGGVEPTGLGTALSWASDPPMVEEQRGMLAPGLIPRHVAGEHPGVRLRNDDGSIAWGTLFRDAGDATNRLMQSGADERSGQAPAAPNDVYVSQPSMSRALGFIPIGETSTPWTTQDGQNARDAFDVAGLAAMGGFAMPKPVNALGSAGGKLATQAAKELPMDQASRLARAREMGFDTDRRFFRGTTANEIEARPNTWIADDPSYANSFASGNGGNVMPLVSRGRYAPGAWSEAEARSAGFQGREFGDGTRQVFDPSNIRSVNAAFDPANSSSANLLAANPDTAAIPSLLAGQQAQTGIADPGDNMHHNSASTRALRLARADGGGIPSEVSTDWLLNRLEDNPHGVGGLAPSVALPMEPTGEARGQGRGESRDPMPSDPVERAGMTPEAQAKAFLRSEVPSAFLGAAPGPYRAVAPVSEALWNTANIVAPAALATMNSGAAAKDEKSSSSVAPEMGREEFLTAWRKNNPRHAVDPGEITARALDAFRASDAYKSLPDASGPKTRGVRERAEKEFVADYMDRFGAGEPQVDYDARADKAWTAYQQHMTDTAAERKADAAYARVMGDRGLAETPFAETWWGRNVNPNITPLIVGGLSGLALGAKGALAERNAASAWEKALQIARTSEVPSERVAAASTAKSMQKAFPDSSGLSGYGVPMALGAVEGVGSTAAPVLWDRALPAESAKHRAAAAALAELPNDHPARKKYQAILNESAVNRPRDEALSVNLGDLGMDAAMRAGMGASAAAAGKTIGGMPSPSGARVSTLREMTTAKPISPDAVEREAERLYAVRNADSDFRFSDRQMRASQQIDDATRQLEQEALRGIVDKGPSQALKRQVQEALDTRALPPPKAPEPQGSLPTPESSASPALPPPVNAPVAAKPAPEPLPQDKPAATRGQGAAEKALRLASPDKVKERSLSPLTSPTPAEGTLPNPMRVVGALDYHYGLLNRQPRFEKNAASIVSGSDDGLREGVRVALKGLLGRSPKPDEIERFMPEAKVWASRVRNGGSGESSALPTMTAKDMIPKRAAGGNVVDRALSLATGGAAKRMAVGPLMGPTGGRADHLPVSVPAGSHVVPADVVSGLGEGNTHAGMLVLDKMFNQGPYGSRVGKRHRAAGGEVPIMASDGEYVVAPEIVEAWGNGNPQAGHDAIDKWIVSKRGDIIDTMQRLPGPAKD